MMNKATWNLKELNVRPWAWVEKSTSQIEDGGDRCQEHHIWKRIRNFNQQEVHQSNGVAWRFIEKTNLLLGICEPKYRKVL